MNVLMSLNLGDINPLKNTFQRHWEGHNIICKKKIKKKGFWEHILRIWILKICRKKQHHHNNENLIIILWNPFETHVAVMRRECCTGSLTESTALQALSISRRWKNIVINALFSNIRLNLEALSRLMLKIWDGSTSVVWRS